MGLLSNLWNKKKLPDNNKKTSRIKNINKKNTNQVPWILGILYKVKITVSYVEAMSVCLWLGISTCTIGQISSNSL
jgi:hypothetical protein